MFLCYPNHSYLMFSAHWPLLSMVCQLFFGHSTIIINWFPAPRPLLSMIFLWFWGHSTIDFNIGFWWTWTFGPMMQWFWWIVHLLSTYFIFKDLKSTNYYLQEDNNIAEVWFFTQVMQLVGRIKVYSIVPTLTLVLELVEAVSDCWSNPHNLIGD